MVEGEEILASRSRHIVSKEFHDGKHGKSTVLNLLGALVHQFVTLRGTTRVEAEVSDEIRSLLVLRIRPSYKLPVSDGTNDLDPAQGRDSTNGTNAVGNRVKGGSIKIDGARETSHSLDQVASHGKHGHTSVL